MQANLAPPWFSSSPDIHPDEACTFQGLAFPNSTPTRRNGNGIHLATPSQQIQAIENFPIAAAVALGILVTACATFVSSAPEPHDYTRTSVLPRAASATLLPCATSTRNTLTRRLSSSRKTERFLPGIRLRKVVDRKDVQVIITGTPDHWQPLIPGSDQRRQRCLRRKAFDPHHRRRQTPRRGCACQKTVLQTGTQQRSDHAFALRAIGAERPYRKLKEVTVWLPAGLREGPFKPVPVPSELIGIFGWPGT